MIGLWVSDRHLPFIEPSVAKLEFMFAKWLSPDFIIFGGDIGDFYGVSKYLKKKREWEEQSQSEIDSIIAYLTKWRRAFPNVRMDYIEGNHEERWEKYILTNARAFRDLRCLKISELLNLRHLEIRYHKDSIVIEKVRYLHGVIVRKYGGYSAIAHMINNPGESLVHGHTHRLATTRITTRGKQFVGVEAGCGAQMNPEYVKNPNWQHGLCAIIDGIPMEVSILGKRLTFGTHRIFLKAKP